MQTVSIEEAKTQFMRLLKAVEAGNEFLITRDGQPIAVLRTYSPPGGRIGNKSLANAADR